MKTPSRDERNSVSSTASAIVPTGEKDLNFSPLFSVKNI
jgi:hypothetical protein